MKRFIYAGLFLLGLCAASSCDKNGGSNKPSAEDFIGYWKLNRVEFYFDDALIESELDEVYLLCQDKEYYFELDTKHFTIEEIQEEAGYLNFTSDWLIIGPKIYSNPNAWGYDGDGNVIIMPLAFWIDATFLGEENYPRILGLSGNTLSLYTDSDDAYDNILGYSLTSEDITDDGNQHYVKFVYIYERCTEEEFNAAVNKDI